MVFALLLIFACGKGCGDPAATTIATYDTLAECQLAGQVWLMPSSNPTGAVSRYECHARHGNGHRGEQSATPPSSGQNTLGSIGR